VDRSSADATAGLQLLLLAGAAVTVLPALIAASRPWWSIAALAGVGSTGLVGGVLARRGRAQLGTSERFRVALSLVSTVALVIVLAVDGRDRPEAYLLLTAALVCGLGSLPSRPWRWASQAVAIAAMSATLSGAGRGLWEQGLMLLVLAAVAAVSSVFVDELRSARRSMIASRRRAERRRDLLAAVQRLPTDRFDAPAAVLTLRALGYDAGGIAFIRGERMVAEYLEGMGDGVSPRRGAGLAWRCIDEDRVVVTADYRREPDRLDCRREIGAAVVAPLRIDRRPVGAVMCARRSGSAPTPIEIEVAEVVAAHLSGVLSALEREQRQRGLLERLHRLEAMRSGFIEAVSLELRGPLEAVREASRSLASADRSSNGTREARLDELNRDALELGSTIDAVLDFSRFRSEQGSSAEVVPAPLCEVFAPFGSAADLRVEVDPEVRALTVEVDSELIRRACELLTTWAARTIPAAPVVLSARQVGDEVELTISPSRDIPAVARSLASQLLVGGGGILQPGPLIRIRIPVAEPVGLA
jgi:hypothetical protein